MNKRDKEIIRTLEKHRVMTRDQIISMFFSNQKSAVSNCNLVLKRLSDRGYIKALKEYQPYLYVSADSKIKTTSQKIFHFLRITDTLLEAQQHGKMENLQVEIKLGKKGTIEPDGFFILNVPGLGKSPFFLEVQIIKDRKAMEEKMNRYLQYYQSGEWKSLEWQQETAVFPIILVISEQYYQLADLPFTFLQFPSFTDFMNHYKRQTVVSSAVQTQKTAKPVLKIRLT